MKSNAAEFSNLASNLGLGLDFDVNFGWGLDLATLEDVKRLAGVVLMAFHVVFFLNLCSKLIISAPFKLRKGEFAPKMSGGKLGKEWKNSR